jgi:hypothetical protein
MISMSVKNLSLLSIVIVLKFNLSDHLELQPLLNLLAAAEDQVESSLFAILVIPPLEVES